jgi:two-component system, OmpR family, response regulator VicR
MVAACPWKESRAEMETSKRPPHILAVNDTQEILDLLQVLLEEEGYRVTTSLALLDMDKVKALAPDAIVQDLIFDQSQEKGWHFLTMVRLDPEVAHIPLILCTAAIQIVKDEEMAAKLRNLDVHVVLKPFDIDELLAVLDEVLGRSRRAPSPNGFHHSPEASRGLSRHQ